VKSSWHPCVLRVARIVTDETGNRVEEKNLSTIETRLRSRMLRLGIADLDAYDKFLSANESAERKVLRGLMTTHHTFFFREFQHFDVLQEWVTAKIRSGELSSAKPLKVWSAASSRGQEAHSLAMFLHVHLKQAHNIDFHIYATDIDAESVKYGSNGVYPIKEVQSIPLAYLGKFWSRGTGDISHFAKAKAELRNKITWAEVNLLESKSFAAKHGPFDVVFCRNVFIYFEEQKILSISRDLMSAMREGGLFVTGLSEPISAETLGLSRVGPSSYQTPSKHVQPALSKPVETPLVAKAATPFRVLIVDDSPTIQKLLKKILAEDKIFGEMDLAANGQEAAQLLAKNSYDLITLDIHMPVMGGIEFLEKVYRKDTHAPVLVVSSVSREDRSLATRALELGAKDYVEKPDLSKMKESAGEILSKARTLARMKNTSANTSLELDRAFSRELVISHAQKKMRMIECDFARGSLDLAGLIRSFETEKMSPPNLWIVGNESERNRLESMLRSASKRRVSRVEKSQVFEANAHYVACSSELPGMILDRILPTAGDLSALLCSCRPEVISALESLRVGYVLASEHHNLSVLKKLPWVEQAPVTSYASLSTEVFCGVRKMTRDWAA